MLNRTEAFIRTHKMLPRGGRALCALSGGADSVCLLGVLYALRDKLGITLCAAHYNHNLRDDESHRDENFVRKLVADRFPGVELYIGSGDVAAQAQQAGTGLEETAREMRYAFLRETAHSVGAQSIAVAHTADDNAETVLLHLARGTGLQGLTGIAPVRNDIIRPLLTATRQEVEAFLAQHELPFVEDSSNSDDYFARNRVRHQVIPVLESLYPGFARRLTENAAHIRADEDFLAAQARELTEQALENGETISVSASLLAQSPAPIAIRAVRQLLARLKNGDDTCSAPHLESVLALCGSDSPSGEVHLSGNVVAAREYDTLKLSYCAPQDIPVPSPLPLSGEILFGDWRINVSSCVYAGEKQSGLEMWLFEECSANLLVRTRQEGDRLNPPARPEKSLKKWLIDLKIPRRERDFLPVLTVDGRVAAAALIGPDIGFVPAPGERARHLVFVPPGGQTGKEL